MKILIAYDGTPAADAAVRETLQRNWPAGTEVRLATVVEWPMALEPPFPTDYPGPAVEGVRAIMISKAKKALARAKEAFSARTDLAVTTELREGSPKHALLDVIDTWRPDLVITGSTGKTALKRLILGSVCHALVTHAPCNVLVVKPPVD
jgi:nucleotide-binding universal stress UspA family protein